jgi:ATP-binding cassette subfamily C (CFTR/MRP) protein 10
MMHQSSSLLCFWLLCFAFQRFCCMLVRENLDPMGSASDDQLWEVLEKCHMKRAIIAAGQGLSLVVSEGGDSLSLGQRQLLCLARSLLSTACILCLDECTANVDPHTTVMLKETVAKECSNMTVITIAHRVSTIIDLQHVLIMEHGRLVKFLPSFHHDYCPNSLVLCDLHLTLA